MKLRQPFRFLVLYIAITFALVIFVGNDGSGSTAFVYFFVPTWLSIADATGASASKKGRNYWAFFMLSFVFPVIIWLVVAAMKPFDTSKNAKVKNNLRSCPFCSEDIKVEAIVCKHCSRDIP